MIAYLRAIWRRPSRLAERGLTRFVFDPIGALFGIPPKDLRLALGCASYLEYVRTARIDLQYLIGACGLKPTGRLLDVGCGAGRLAVPLTRYLDAAGGYDGLEIDSRYVDWCTRTISSRHKNFRFVLADIHNTHYNPNGKYEADEYRFPYEAESFDVVFLASVFTHMLPSGLDNYLSEIARVLKRGGRSFVTYFLLNPESLRLIKAGSSTLDFKHDAGTYRTISETTPETAVAYDERFLRSLYDKCALSIEEPIRYGSWCGRRVETEYQDVIISVKR